MIEMIDKQRHKNRVTDSGELLIITANNFTETREIIISGFPVIKLSVWL
jgi:hypothetical protein